MKTKTKNESLVTFWRSEKDGDVGAVRVSSEGLTIHSHVHQRRQRHSEIFVLFEEINDALFRGTSVYLMNETGGVIGVPLDDERSARELFSLANAGISADEERLLKNAKEVRERYGNEEVHIRPLRAPTYDPSKREAIVARLPLQDETDATLILNELRKRHLAAVHALKGPRRFRAYWSLPNGAGESSSGGYAELAYEMHPAGAGSPPEQWLLCRHDGFEHELSPTTEEHVFSGLSEAAPSTVYIEGEVG